MEENKNLEQQSENHVEKIHLSDDMRRFFRKCLSECYEEANVDGYYGDDNKEYVINNIFKKYFDNETLELELQNVKEQKHQINNDSYTLLDKNATNQVNTLIKQGWEFTIHYGEHTTYCDIQEPCFEVDFTRRKDNGLWDNHMSGYDISPNLAIEKAYNNIKRGIRLKR